MNVKKKGGVVLAKLKRETIRSRIEKDLMNQLSEKNITGNHYENLVQDYLSLWDIKCDLVNDIAENGIKVNGMHGPKSNPSVNDLHKTNDRMIKILDALSLQASPHENSNDQKRSGSPDDLI